MDEQFINSEMHSAFDADALETTHAIVAEVDTPSTINSIFDTISYNKGSTKKLKLRDLIYS